jgi:hypothetical protein
VWGNLAATVCAVGLATAAAAPWVVRGLALPEAAKTAVALWKSRSTRVLEPWRAAVDPTALLAAAGAVAILAADLSGLSKAETERIWLPFDVWLLAGTALLPRRSARVWLALQGVAALVINHLLMTSW